MLDPRFRSATVAIMNAILNSFPNAPIRAVALFITLFLLPSAASLPARDFKSIPTEPTLGDKMLEEYFEKESRRLAFRTGRIVGNSETNWTDQSVTLRRQLYEMLGLSPLPARSPLKPVVTGTFNHDGVVIEKIHFQSRPGLYVTANFYRPERQEGPLPAILYVCGHGRVKEGDISMGNKANYQHHPLWFARNGYVCLIVDTLQLGEIEGIHHGTYRHDRWWWNSRGYTPAGVEAWNGIRALDYLATRPEVDIEKVGLTGRSGGGAYSFWIAALDERIKVAAPVAGIASLHNHVVDGCVEGHCDCMFMVNTYRWDFPLVASLIAPRPLLIINTDKDRIFPIDGVVDVYTKTAQVYERLNQLDHIGLAFYEGPHKDTQPLRVAAFHWFERHLKGKELEYEMEETRAPKEIKPADLRVFKQLPENERNTSIDEYFTRRIPRRLRLPESEADWQAHRAVTLSRLKSKTFRGWPAPEDAGLSEDFRANANGITFAKYTFTSQSPFRLPLYVAHRKGLELKDLDLVVLNVLDESTRDDFISSMGAAFPEAFLGEELPALDPKKFEAEKKMYANQKWGMAYFAPRGIGATRWTSDERERIQIRRRFALLGQTVDGMRIWDIRRAVQSLRSIDGLQSPQLWIQSNGMMAGNSLYASIFEKNIHRLDLHALPLSHRDGPELLNVLRFTDIPQIVTFAAKNSQLRIYSKDSKQWNYPIQVSKKFKWDEKAIQIRDSLPE